MQLLFWANNTCRGGHDRRHPPARALPGSPSTLRPAATEHCPEVLLPHKETPSGLQGQELNGGGSGWPNWARTRISRRHGIWVTALTTYAPSVTVAEPHPRVDRLASGSGAGQALQGNRWAGMKVSDDAAAQLEGSQEWP